MINPNIIYKKFHKYKPISELNGIQWFALTDNYGNDVYGNTTKSYKFKKHPKLLNIGDADVRVMIENEVSKDYPKLIDDCDIDKQYSGTIGNKKYHTLIQNIFGNEYDGTIIDEKQLHGNTKYSISDLEGPSEIVIWKDHDNLLEELPDNYVGKGISTSIKSNNKRKGKMQKGKTQKGKTRKGKTRKGKTRKGKTRKGKTQK